MAWEQSSEASLFLLLPTSAHSNRSNSNCQQHILTSAVGGSISWQTSTLPVHIHIWHECVAVITASTKQLQAGKPHILFLTAADNSCKNPESQYFITGVQQTHADALLVCFPLKYWFLSHSTAIWSVEYILHKTHTQRWADTHINVHRRMKILASTHTKAHKDAHTHTHTLRLVWQSSLLKAKPSVQKKWVTKHMKGSPICFVLDCKCHFTCPPLAAAVFPDMIAMFPSFLALSTCHRRGAFAIEASDVGHGTSSLLYKHFSFWSA